MVPETTSTLPSSQQGWSHFEHVADMGVRGTGGTLAEAFEQAAIAMTAIITDPALVRASQSVDIVCSGGDRELLLVDWLNAVVYQMSVHKMLFSRFRVTVSGEQLSARAWGEPIDMARHQPAVEIKAATYTELAVFENQGQWTAQCVVDV